MKTDARIRYTLSAISRALLTLLREKPLRRIAVTEICALAEINRATFYNHYRDMFDLMANLQDEILSHIEETLRALEQPNASAKLTAFLTRMKKHHREFAVLFSENGDPAFAARIAERIFEVHADFHAGLFSALPEDQRLFACDYMQQGSCAIFARWLKSGMKTPPEEITALALTLNEVLLAGLKDMRGA